MAASIRSLRNGVSPVIGASRDDLALGDTITLESVDTATTYAWTLAYKPPGSTATIPSPLDRNPGSFTVDEEGPYLIRLTVDLGLGTENTQYVRLRYLTEFEDFTLVAAGEQNSSGIPVPVDQTTDGWANEQNTNLLKLIDFVSTVSASGRVLYVDANDGTSEYGDHATIQEAIDFAVTQTPSVSEPWVVLVRPGTYVEDLTFAPHVHVVAWEGNTAAEMNNRTVLVQGVHTMSLPLGNDRVTLAHLTFENPLNTTTSLLAISGDGFATLYRSVLLQNGTDISQGPAVSTTGTVEVTADHCYIQLNTTAGAVRPAILVDGTGATFKVLSSQVTGPSGVDIEEDNTFESRDTRITAAAGGTSTFAVRTEGVSTLLEYSTIQVQPVVTNAIQVNPTGSAVAADVGLTIRWTFVSGDIQYDTTGMAGTTSLSLGSVEYGSLSFPGGSPGTFEATTKAASLFYDNSTSGLTSSTVQGALDEVTAIAEAVQSLDEAYDGGTPGSGSGRTILADQGPVQILDAASPSDPPVPGNTDGGLQVVGPTEVGSIDNAEIVLDPNPYGNGPVIRMGQAVVANNAPFGNTSFVFGNSTGSPAFRNYNLRLQTLSSSGGGSIGRVSVRAGDGLDSAGTTPDAGSVFIQAGSAYSGSAGDAGDIYVIPGASAFSGSGSTIYGNPSAATGAALTASGAFSGGVTGTISFATDMGRFSVDIDSADILSAVLTKFDATGQVLATQAAGVITLTTRSKGPNAEIYFLNDDQGGTLDTALGTFDGQLQTDGTLGESIRFDVTADNEITFGAGGATGPMIYNSDTGKLTVPGIIDPTGLVLEEVAPLTAAAGKGVIFIGDGTGGTTQGNFYFRHESGALQDISASVGGSALFEVLDEGSSLGTTFGSINFVGSGVTATDAGAGQADITITATSPLTVEDEGSSVETNTSILNFTGAGVTASSAGGGEVTVNIGGGGSVAVSREDFAASAFTFGGSVSTVTLANSLNTIATLTGIIECFRNGLADMTRTVAAPTTADEFRITGSTLEIGADITGTSDVYRVAYPYV